MWWSENWTGAGTAGSKAVLIGVSSLLLRWAGGAWGLLESSRQSGL